MGMAWWGGGGVNLGMAWWGGGGGKSWHGLVGGRWR